MNGYNPQQLVAIGERSGRMIGVWRAYSRPHRGQYDRLDVMSDEALRGVLIDLATEWDEPVSIVRLYYSEARAERVFPATTHSGELRFNAEPESFSFGVTMRCPVVPPAGARAARVRSGELQGPALHVSVGRCRVRFALGADREMREKIVTRMSRPARAEGRKRIPVRSKAAADKAVAAALVSGELRRVAAPRRENPRLAEIRRQRAMLEAVCPSVAVVA